MTRLASYAAAALLLCAAASAQDGGYWKAMSTTARSITGDITISSEKLLINFAAFAIADIRPLSAVEIEAIFSTELSTGMTGSKAVGELYRLSIPAKKTFLRRNVLCGAEDTQWMVTSVAGRTLQVAFLSGSTMPAFTQEAVANSTALCGTFSYTR